MSAQLTNDIHDQIKKNLPGLVGDELVKRLQQADKDAIDLDTARRKLVEMDRYRHDAESMRVQLKGYDERVATVVKREADATLREKLIEMREKHADEKVALMRGVVTDVFANNRFKYNETGYVPVVTPPSQYSAGGMTSGSISRTVESQG